MTATRDKFNNLSLRLFDKFEIGGDLGESAELRNEAVTNPLGVEITPAETKSVRCARTNFDDFQGEENVQLGDVFLIFRIDELEGFNIDTATRVTLDGRKYSVQREIPSGKDIVVTVQCRSI